MVARICQVLAQSIIQLTHFAPYKPAASRLTTPITAVHRRHCAPPPPTTAAALRRWLCPSPLAALTRPTTANLSAWPGRLFAARAAPTTAHLGLPLTRLSDGPYESPCAPHPLINRPNNWALCVALN